MLKDTHCESPNGAFHGGIDHHVVIDSKEVAVKVLLMIVLLSFVSHSFSQGLAPILDDHAVLLHFHPSN